jgi:hypothetical protein
MSDRQSIAVWFSCGAASAVAAKETLRLYGSTHGIHVVNNPVAEEDADNRRFLVDVQDWLGVTIEIATCSEYPDGSADRVWRDRRYMAGNAGAPCTMFLKKRARQQWESRNPVDFTVLGFTADERDRFERFRLTERDTTLPVLIDQGITKAECFQRIAEAGLELPRVYRLGYPNANCIGCVKATSPTYWNHVRATHPIVFAARADLSREVGARLVRHKGKRIFLDELPTNARGADMRSMRIECGIFCEEVASD